MNRNLKTVTPQTSLREAIQIMLDEDLDGLPVADEKNHSLGIITLGYLLRGFMPDHLQELPEITQNEVEAVNIQAFFGPTSFLFMVADFFKNDVEPVTIDTSLMSAAASMEAQQLHMLPVVKGNKLIAVLTRHDIMQAFFSKSLPGSTKPTD